MNTSLVVIFTLVSFGMLFMAFNQAKKQNKRGKYFLSLFVVILAVIGIMILNFKYPDVLLIEYCLIVVPGLASLLLYLYFLLSGLKKKEE